MKKIFPIVYLVIIAFLTPFASFGEKNETARLIDSLDNVLAGLDSSKDSVAVLYDMLDLVRLNDREPVCEKLLSAAQRGSDMATQYDVMRRLGNIYCGNGQSAFKIKELIDIAASRPLSNDQRMTLAFLRVQANIAEDRAITEEVRRKKVHELIRTKGIVSSEDPYDRVEYLFMLCRFLRNNVNGDMLSRGLDELGEKLRALPGDNTPLNNSYYVQASLVYTVSGQFEKAVFTSRELLKLIDELDKKSKKEGHQFRNYDLYRYVAMRRLLTNFPILNEAEIDFYYDQMKKLVVNNPDLRTDFEKNQRPTIYYLMGKKKYAEALKILEKQVDNPKNRQFDVQLYSFMLEAATAVGNKELMLKASMGYNKLLNEIKNERMSERNYELGLMDDMHDLAGLNNTLLAQQEANAKRYHDNMVKGIIIGSIIFLIVIFALLYLYGKSRRLSVSLGKANEKLVSERNALQRTQQELIEARDHACRADRHKTDFINNMSHEICTPLNALVECSHLIVDNMDDAKRKYLKRYADMIDVNADMLSVLVKDVLDIAEMDNSQIRIQRKIESVNAICQMAVNSMKKHCKPGVVMSYINGPGEDVKINTDALRVEQVLINLLSNGAKFTERGYVNLSYALNPNNRTITFVVEDSGIGVPRGKEDIIFERFEKLSNLTSGTGLGLNISRMIADMLGGSIKVDTTYQGPGARFMFTIPL